MSESTCFRAQALLAGRAAGLTEAERLVLERHLTECARCRDDGELLRRMSELSERAATAARVSGSTERLLARVHARAVEQPSSSGSLWPARARFAFALAALAALALVLVGARLWQARRASSTAAYAAQGGVVLAGSVSAAGRPLARGAAVPEQTALEVAPSAELALAHAHVRAPEAASLSWSGADACLALGTGAIDVDVDPRPKRPFAVKTARFRVDVLGTEFHVDADSVSVSRGRVRVSSAAGAAVAVLDAGQRWTVSELAATPVAATPSVASPAAPVDDAQADGAAPAAPAASQAGTRSATAGESLALARHALASGDVSGARRALELALAEHPRSDQQAEAHMLLGDAARIAGNLELSSSEYLGVFERYRALPLAETALFSAARVQARAGHSARAEQLFARYLAAYPRGQFHAQALERVQARAGGQ